MSRASLVVVLALLLGGCDSGDTGEVDQGGGDADVGGGDAEAESTTEDGAEGGEAGSADADADADDDVDLADVVEESAAEGDGTSGRAWPDGNAITIEEVHERLLAGDAEMHLLNVVDEEFYDLGHIPGSLVIPWDELPGMLDHVDRSWHVVLYCRRGVRSATAYDTLIGAGYTMVWIMTGSLEAWLAAGYSTVLCGDPTVTCL